MTDGEARTVEVDLSFLDGESYRATVFSDGKNADRYASDYHYATRELDPSSAIEIPMAPGGGWVAVIKPQ
ncbi:MAG: glycoside hydrolase family 97 C-terminal domain-containing protein [Balneolaceae bacterium]|nr:glycoside hydrolase family 97 C-terminal domain-containing protein [Balneolaceae bacterium]